MQEDILYYNQALNYAKEGAWLEAESLLEQAIALKAEEAEYHSLLAVVYLGLKHRHLAIEQLRLAYQLNSQDPLLQKWMALLIFGISNGPNDQDKPPDLDSWWGGGSQVPHSPCPSNPYPFVSSGGAEALPDDGSSQIP